MFTFASKGEAAFVQSLLAAEGIEAQVLDGSGDLGGPASARLVVDQEYLEAASRIIADFKKTTESLTPAVKPVVKPFPFGAIVFWVTLGFGALGLVGGISAVRELPGEYRTISKVSGVFSFYFFLMLLTGIFAGIGLATVAAVVRIVWRKWQSTPLP